MKQIAFWNRISFDEGIIAEIEAKRVGVLDTLPWEN
jgi:hypothetical protein